MRLPWRRRPLVAAAVLVAVIAAAASFAYPGPGAVGAATVPCTQVLVVGLRGSGDPVDAGHGMGGDSWAVASRLGERLAGRFASTMIGFSYDNGPWWRIGGHVRSAAGALRAFVQERHGRCPAERLALIGQSEGAAVVHLALPSLGNGVTTAVLIADPLRIAGTPVDVLRSPHDGVLAPLLLGAWGGVGPAREVIPGTLAARVRSYCLRDDPVCDASPSAVWQRTYRDIHTTYRLNPGGIADRAAEFAASRLIPVNGERSWMSQNQQEMRAF